MCLPEVRERELLRGGMAPEGASLGLGSTRPEEVCSWVLV